MVGKWPMADLFQALRVVEVVAIIIMCIIYCTLHTNTSKAIIMMYIIYCTLHTNTSKAIIMMYIIYCTLHTG